MRRAVFAINSHLRLFSKSAGSLTEEATVAATTKAEDDLLTIAAIPREDSGTRYCEKLRKEGRTPATLFSLPGNKSQLLSVDSKQISRLVESYGRRQLQSRLCRLEIQPHDRQPPAQFNVLPRNVHRNSKTDMVENVTFMFCPPDRQVEVAVPVRVIGEEISPGMKAGGFVNAIRKVIHCSCPGSIIPEYIEVDVSHLNIGQRIGLDALKLAPGVTHLEKILDQPVVKMAGRRS